MIATIDKSGRLVIPKALRDEAGLVPGEPLELTVHDGRVEIVPAPRSVNIRKRSGLCVAEAAGPYEPLTQKTVRDVRDKQRDRKRD